MIGLKNIYIYIYSLYLQVPLYELNSETNNEYKLVLNFYKTSLKRACAIIFSMLDYIYIITYYVDKYFQSHAVNQRKNC
jgi:hypothetical protein